MCRAVAILLAGLLAACAASPPGDMPPAEGGAGATFLSVIGTPFLIAFKIPVCAATLAIAAPVAGVAQIAGPGSGDGTDLKAALVDGVAQNCGPPYYVTR